MEIKIKNAILSFRKTFDLLSDLTDDSFTYAHIKYVNAENTISSSGTVTGLYTVTNGVSIPTGISKLTYRVMCYSSGISSIEGLATSGGSIILADSDDNYITKVELSTSTTDMEEGEINLTSLSTRPTKAYFSFNGKAYHDAPTSYDSILAFLSAKNYYLKGE